MWFGWTAITCSRGYGWRNKLLSRFSDGMELVCIYTEGRNEPQLQLSNHTGLEVLKIHVGSRVDAVARFLRRGSALCNPLTSSTTATHELNDARDYCCLSRLALRFSGLLRSCNSAFCMQGRHDRHTAVAAKSINQCPRMDGA